ncbi:hypothetical protein ITP77_002987 [Salmonella enterica subsp. enterica serovar Java]|nr:hypothetical protein [Salmonella enterica subsp. enterica serovar Java]
MATLKGVMRDELGNNITGCTITFIEQETSRRFFVTTASGEAPGSYTIILPPGRFRVLVKPARSFERDLGEITVYSDSPDGSLGDFLTRRDVDTRPEALKQFEALAQQTREDAQLATESSTSAQSAAEQASVYAQHTAEAATTATGAASTATGSAREAQDSEHSASQSAKTAQENAATVSKEAADVTLAKEEVVRQVTGFDEHVSQQTASIRQAATDATTKATTDIAETGEKVKQAVQAQGQELVDKAYTEALNAAQSAQDARTATLNAQEASTGASQARDEALTSATAAKSSETASADSAESSEKSAQEAKLSAEQAAASSVVKTDGKTLTGDGNATPLALGPAEPYAVGTYITAKFNAGYLFDGRAPTDGSLIERGTVLDMGDVLGTIVDGSLLMPSDTNRYNTYVFHPPGQWISCSSIYIVNMDIIAVWRRIR